MYSYNTVDMYHMAMETEGLVPLCVVLSIYVQLQYGLTHGNSRLVSVCVRPVNLFTGTIGFNTWKQNIGSRMCSSCHHISSNNMVNAWPRKQNAYVFVLSFLTVTIRFKS